MADDLESVKKLARRYLNPAIRGPNTDAILEAIASGPMHLIDNIEAVDDQLYLVSASGRYLDERLADRDIIRPDNVGLSDEDAKKIGIKVSNTSQIRTLIMQILNIMYGDEFTRATLNSTELETYTLSDNDNLILQFDDGEEVEIFFKSSQFASIAAATAQEVADAITKELRRLGKKGSALAKDNGIGPFVQLISDTDGPSSTIKVLGGKAQNELRFESIRATTGDSSTQWALSQGNAGRIRATWTGGANPSIGKIKVNDYVNIYGTAFDISNRGTFTIEEVKSGIVNEAYVEFSNPNGVIEVTVQGTDDAILFFNPIRSTITRKVNYAAAYQFEHKVFEVFMPATTKVVRRDRIGAAYVKESVASTDDLGPYIFDTSAPYSIGGEEAFTTQEVDPSTGRIVEVDDATPMPDDTGSLIFEFGTSREEGPVPYIARPSSTAILIDPSYKFQKTHPVGSSVSLVSLESVYDIEQDGSDYPFYITDTVSGRLYAEDLINLVKASGFNVIINILYPDDTGLGKWGDETNSEKYEVWGPDEE